MDPDDDGLATKGTRSSFEWRTGRYLRFVIDQSNITMMGERGWLDWKGLKKSWGAWGPHADDHE